MSTTSTSSVIRRPHLRRTYRSYRAAAASPAASQRLRALGVLLSVALLGGTALPVGLAAPAAAAPAAPALAASTASAGELDRAVIRIDSPRQDTLVSGAPLTVKVWTAGGTSDFHARTDHGDVTSSFRRVGREWVGLVRGLPAGSTTLVVTTSKSGRSYRARAPITIKGPQKDLLSLAPLSDLLSATSGPAVKPVLVTVDSSATTTAKLNGHPVPLSRHRGSAAIRAIVMSKDDGLRTGANTLVVQSYRKNGDWER